MVFYHIIRTNVWETFFFYFWLNVVCTWQKKNLKNYFTKQRNRTLQNAMFTWTKFILDSKKVVAVLWFINFFLSIFVISWPSMLMHRLEIFFFFFRWNLFEVKRKMKSSQWHIWCKCIFYSDEIVCEQKKTHHYRL